MSNPKLTETVTTEVEVTGVLRDLVLFAKHLRLLNLSEDADDATLIRVARAFWDQQHGE